MFKYFDGRYLQLMLPEWLKPWGQLLETAAAQEVQVV